MKTTTKLFSVLIVTSLVVGCASTTPTSEDIGRSLSNQQPAEMVIKSVAEGLRLANAASEPIASKILVRTARLALDQGDLVTSNRLAETLTTEGFRRKK